MQVQPYLFFNGNCEEALEFYKKAVGAEVQAIFRYKDSPEPPPADKIPANWGDKIMHANIRIGETQVMASDGCPQEGAGFKNFSLTISAAKEADADRLFNALANGGEVQMPLGKTFFSPCFGMVTDKFGLSWMVAYSMKARKQQRRTRRALTAPAMDKVGSDVALALGKSH